MALCNSPPHDLARYIELLRLRRRIPAETFEGQAEEVEMPLITATPAL